MSRLIVGRVASDKGDKTIIVSVTARKTHPIYKKGYTTSARFAAHDPENKAKTGDRVVIRETRPISATKSFVLEKILQEAEVEFVESDAQAGIPVDEKPAKAAEKTAKPSRKPAAKDAEKESKV